jgi:hypothetical protein
VCSIGLGVDAHRAAEGRTWVGAGGGPVDGHHIDTGGHVDRGRYVHAGHHIDTGGHVDRGHYVHAGHHIDTGRHVDTGHHVDARRHVFARRHVDAGGHIDRGRYVLGGGDVFTGRYVLAGFHVDAGTIFARRKVFWSVFWWSRTIDGDIANSTVAVWDHEFAGATGCEEHRREARDSKRIA